MNDVELADRLAHSRVPLPGTTNVRDLAGYPGSEGTVIGPRRLMRGELLADASGTEKRQAIYDPVTAAEFEALGLLTVIDLRSEREVAGSPSAWGAATGADVVRLPIEEGGEGTDTHFVQQLLSGERAAFSEADMTDFYLGTLERQAATFAAVVSLLARPGHAPTLVHCSAGKDRTGLATALVLELLGTPREVVVGDYALTGRLRPDRHLDYRDLFESAGRDPAAAKALFGTPAQSMADVLQHLDERYGGAATYLVQGGGLNQRDVDALRAALLVPAIL